MKIASRALFLFGVAIALTSVVGVVLNYSPVPWWDQWFGTVNWYMEAEKHWWPSFWSLHNEHRLLFSRLIFWPDMRWFGGVNILSLAGNVVVCALLALAVYRAAIFRAVSSPTAKLGIGGVALAFCFSWMQIDNFTWGFQNQWFAVNLFALLAFHALSVSAAEGYSGKWFLLALLSCVASSFSMANGSIAWLLVFALLLYWRFPSRFFVSAGVVCAVIITAYFHKASSAAGSIPHGTLSYVLHKQPFDLAHYAVLYLGSPMVFASVRSYLADIAGAAVIATSLAGFVWAVARRDLKGMPLLALALFLCATAFATGVGRLVLGLGNVFQPRYATNALMAWMALTLFWMLNAQTRLLRWPLYGCLLIGLVSIGVCQRSVFSPNRDVIFNRLVAGQAAREGVYDHAYMGVLWDHDDYLKTIIEAAKVQRLSILAPDAVGYDNPPARIDATERCAGFVDGSILTETPGMSRAEGWVFNETSEPQTVVVTDDTGKTIGNGVVGKFRPDAAEALRTKNERIGWVAFYKTTSPVHVFAKTGDGYCKIN